ncbi:hypothetical protein [uncultured Brevundimonas sp.]|uniref:hypothetical protein n=1 Tax=uncultured Brevundimonas sp. TaxID=213418 RepID=UPI002604761D|nr:hypothetical protein [uncultured Brevundimonas sp.]
MTRRTTPATRRPHDQTLAESRWLWRRLYAFTVSAGLWVLLMRTVARMPAEMLPKMTDGLMGLLALILVLYLVAPTAQQLATLVANVRLRPPVGRP